jgi:putative transposase
LIGAILEDGIRMARPIRFLAPGLIYHVMARGNNKMRLFFDDRDYLRFLDMVGDVLQKREVDCWTYCIMPNHYHLVWRTRLPNLSDAAHDLNGRFAQWWNKRHKHVGHIYQGRFKAQVVEDSLYLLRLCRYVMLNPVRAKLCAVPEEWRWSGYRALLTGVADPPWIDIESLLERFEQAGISETRRRLLAFITDAVDDEMAAFVRGDRRIIGSDAYAARFEKKALAASTEVPAPERRIGSPSLATILASSLHTAEGLSEGIVRAHLEYAHSVEDIARCTRLSPRTIAQILRRRVPGADVTLLD